MDKRSLISAGAMLGFVLMLVGTSKSRPSSSGPTPFPTIVDATAPLEEDAGELGELDPIDAAAPFVPGDAGRASGPRDGGAPVGVAGKLQLPPPWDDVGVPAGGKMDAIRLVHRGADADRVRADYLAAFVAKGWSLAEAADPRQPGQPLTLVRKRQRLILRVTPQDEDVVVSLNLLPPT